MSITINKNSSATVLTIRNFENLHFSMTNPVDTFADPTSDEDDATLVQLLGPTMIISFDWVLTEESTSVVTGTGSPVTTAVAQQKYIYDTLMPKGADSITDTYTLTIDYGDSVTYVKTGRPSKCEITMSANEPLTFRAHVDFQVGTVV